MAAAESDGAEIRAALAALGAVPDETIDLAETALLLAALDRPQVALARYRLHLRDLADGVGRAVGAQHAAAPLDVRLDALIGVLAAEHGYRGDALTYDDLQNANLMRVIDRRKGLPVALGILYIHAARAQGWRAYGLNFPSHFLLAVEDGGGRAILDPFRAERIDGAQGLRDLLKSVAGAEAELAPAHTAALGNRAVLVRLQNNIKMRAAAQGDMVRALAVIERMLLFAPDRIELWREAGMMQAHQGNIRAALDALARFLDASRDEAARHEVAQLVQSLRRKLN